jgi:hypothetical protein
VNARRTWVRALAVATVARMTGPVGCNNTVTKTGEAEIPVPTFQSPCATSASSDPSLPDDAEPPCDDADGGDTGAADAGDARDAGDAGNAGPEARDYIEQWLALPCEQVCRRVLQDQSTYVDCRPPTLSDGLLVAHCTLSYQVSTEQTSNDPGCQSPP